jgi:hypothetical protein
MKTLNFELLNFELGALVLGLWSLGFEFCLGNSGEVRVST